MRIERSGEGLTVLPVAADQIVTHFSALGLEGGDTAAVHPYLFAATREIEDMAGLALIRHSITLRNVTFAAARRSAWWSGVRQGVPEKLDVTGAAPVYLPVRPAHELTEVHDAEGDEALTGFRIYGVDDPELKAVVAPVGPVDVTYVAGYGDDPAAVPADLRLAVLDHALRLYERRGDEIDTPVGLSATAARIVARYRRVQL